uniref:Uncharacterized protein n=1 Tax=Quercus lobata TaxID=97700 RepID=A0A7N2MMN2_QUELO
MLYIPICKVAKDPSGKEINALAEHIQNLLTPSTSLFFNTLYDPYGDGADFVRGYPFSLRGVSTAISHGLWLNIPDYDAPTQLVKPRERNTKLSFLSLLVRLAVASYIGVKTGLPYIWHSKASNPFVNLKNSLGMPCLPGLKPGWSSIRPKEASAAAEPKSLKKEEPSPKSK